MWHAVVVVGLYSLTKTFASSRLANTSLSSNSSPRQLMNVLL